MLKLKPPVWLNMTSVGWHRRAFSPACPGVPGLLVLSLPIIKSHNKVLTRAPKSLDPKFKLFFVRFWIYGSLRNHYFAIRTVICKTSCGIKCWNHLEGGQATTRKTCWHKIPKYLWWLIASKICHVWIFLFSGMQQIFFESAQVEDARCGYSEWGPQDNSN